MTKGNSERARPNILLILADQATARAVGPGCPCSTPHLDSLAARGVRFHRCYAPNAICSPSRASLMTGLYPSTHGIWDVTHCQRPEWVSLPAGRFPFFSQHLAGAGYRNGYFGKWHVEQTNRLEDFGWHEYDLHCQSLGAVAKAGTELKQRTPGYRDFFISGISADEETDRHPAFDRGIDFIRRCSDNSDQPFCCVVSTIEPHDPYIAPQRFYEQYDLYEIELNPTLHSSAADKPEVVRRMQAVWSDLTDDDWRRITASYWAVISFLDQEVGRILRALEQTGQADNTIVLFTSDHGDMMGGHGLLTKGVGTPYEEVYNIPLILHVPGLTAGGENRQTLTSLVDVGPTLLDLCGVEPLPDSQGRSLRPVLDGSADPAEWRRAYGEFYGQRFVYTQRIVWDGDWKYVFSPGGIDELYNLAEDPFETTNRAAEPAYRTVLEEMCAHMWRKMEELDDWSLYNTRYATLRTAPIGPQLA